MPTSNSDDFFRSLDRSCLGAASRARTSLAFHGCVSAQSPGELIAGPTPRHPSLGHVRVLPVSRALQLRNEGDIVGEDYDLSCLSEVHETFGHSLATNVIERGHGVVQNQC